MMGMSTVDWQSTFIVIAGLFAAALPLLKIYSNWSTNKKDAKVNEAEGTLYTHMAEQLKANTEALNTAYTERNKLVEDYATIKVRLSHLEQNEKHAAAVQEKLIAKLEEREQEIRELSAEVKELVQKLLGKDEVIQARDEMIRQQHEEMAKLTERIHQLEMRLESDETTWCKTCAMAGANGQAVPQQTS